MTIREYLKSIGATEAELSAKVVGRMESRMLFDTDMQKFAPDTVMQIVKMAVDELRDAGRISSKIEVGVLNANAAASRLENAIRQSEMQLKDLERQTAGIKDAKIENRETRDAVMAYTATLRATREIFGEAAMTPEVMAETIKAGSYIAWRGIMGPKEPETMPKRRY